MPRPDPKDPVLATNRKAFHDYTVLDRWEAGIHLCGTEVKSCRARAIQLQEGYVHIANGRALLENVHIAPYDFGNRFNHKATQTRELLMHRKEILHWQSTGKAEELFADYVRQYPESDWRDMLNSLPAKTVHHLNLPALFPLLLEIDGSDFRISE